MAMVENEATAKDATSTRSDESNKLNATAPQVRTAEALVTKHEQILDALEQGRISSKVAEQMNQACKGILGIAKLELQYRKMQLLLGRGAIVPRSSVLRSLAGLPSDISPTDGEIVRGDQPQITGSSDAE